jgi:lipoprotein NlpI
MDSSQGSSLACTLVGLLSITIVLAQHAVADEKTEKLVAQSKAAWAAGETTRAIEVASQAIEGDPDSARLRFYRGTLYVRQRRHEQALADFDRVLEIDPRNADAYGHRGSERFTLGRFADSIADFDREIELDPPREPGHWKRGISYYYAGRYDEGRKQFEGYQTVDGNDVENAVWRFLCMARKEGVAAARRDLLKIKRDRRVPMMEVYALFAGQATPDDVVQAVRAGDPPTEDLKHRQFYAELYLGLYHDALGDESQAIGHLQAAVEHRIEHYMWDVAKVHADLLAERR